MDISIMDVIGPVMIGPSSSHTAGAARLGGAAAHFAEKRLTEQNLAYMDRLRKHIADMELIWHYLRVLLV